MRGFYLVLLIPCYSKPVYSQCYQIDSIAYQPETYTGTGVISSQLSFPDFNKYSTVIDIGFSFCFFGDTVTQLIVGENGIVSFDLDSANGSCPDSIMAALPDPSNPTNSILSPYQDVKVPWSPFDLDWAARVNLIGTAPNRRFVISFDNVSLVTTDCAGVDDSSRSQVILYETTNEIEIHIGEKNVCPGWNNGAAILGIQNQDGNEGYVPQGKNFPDQWMAVEESFRFTPLCYCQTNVTSNEELSSETIEIYPNPTTGEINISNLNSNNKIHSIRLLDIQGRELKLLNQNQSTFDMNEFSEGVYLLRFETEKGLITKRIIKN